MSEKTGESTDKAMTTASVVLNEEENTKIRVSQTDYKGRSHFDKVDVEIIKDGSFYKKGQKDKVHPTLAAILKSKGLIKSYKGEPKKTEEAK